jgi:DNA-binding GntR family transcriptional regulator
MVCMTEVARVAANQLLTKEELVARHVREGIVAGRLVPGQRLLQSQLADQLGFSQTPVREALRGLVTEGWLVRESHVGVSVAAINPDGVDEIYRLRALLEGDLAAEAAARVSAGLLGEIRQLNEAYRQAVGANDTAATRAANFQFHAAIWAGAASPAALGFVNALWARVPRPAATEPQRSQRTIAEHERVIAALSSGDPEKARTALADHIRSGQHDYHRTFDPRP